MSKVTGGNTKPAAAATQLLAVQEKKLPATKQKTSRENVLIAATKQFARRGFDGVVIRDIAREAGVTLPTIYHFFDDKRTLYEQACIKIFITQTGPLQDALTGAEEPAAKLYNFTTKLVKILAEETDFSKLLQRELLEQDYSLIGDSVRSSLLPHFELLMAAVNSIGPKQDKLNRGIAIYSLAFGMTTLQPVWDQLGARNMPRPKTSVETAVLILICVFPELDWKTIAKQQGKVA